MELYLNFVPQSEGKLTYWSYYNFFENIHGANIFSYFSKRALMNGNKPSQFIQSFDTNYQYADEAINNAYNKDHWALMGLYTPNQELVAIGRVRFNVPANPDNALVGEVIIVNEMLPDNIKTEIYKEFVTQLEKSIGAALKSVSLLTFEVPAMDEAFMTSVEELGYDLAEEESFGHITYLYDKQIKEKSLRRVKEDNEVPKE